MTNLEKRNPFVVAVVRLLVWINWEWDWVMPFGMNQFPRSLDLLWRIARDGIEKYPETTSPLLQRWSGRVRDIPGAPTGHPAFKLFLAWLTAECEYSDNPSSPKWKRVVYFVESARQQRYTDLSFRLAILGFHPNSDDPFLFELGAWLASFLPRGKPIIVSRYVFGRTFVSMVFPSGTALHLHSFDTNDNEGEEALIKTYQTLLDIAPAEVYFYGYQSMNGPRVFHLSPDGWAEGVIGEPDEPHEAAWVSKYITGSPLR